MLDQLSSRGFSSLMFPLIPDPSQLGKAGVKVLVCGQSLAKKEVDASAVRADITVAVSALTAIAAVT
jgi:intracellular sulfur oxidation DsrE/DsrF family protein